MQFDTRLQILQVTFIKQGYRVAGVVCHILILIKIFASISSKALFDHIIQKQYFSQRIVSDLAAPHSLICCTLIGMGEARGGD